ncbi:MAG: MFS transporter [bacterium]
MTIPDSTSSPQIAWYQGISRYQWLVLILASAGWVFDVYESQIFNTTRQDLLEEMVRGLSGAEKDDQVKYLGDLFLGIFLAGGMVGGLFFGALGDRWGRRPTMILTILMYSIFSGLTYFAQNLWQVGVLRFLVSMGIGGEWAIGAALVSEVFPARARSQAGAIFHASSTFGTWLAGTVAMIIGSSWRFGYLVGTLPALLILWIRSGLKEPDTWIRQKQEQKTQSGGSLKELLGDRKWRGRAIAGLLLAAVGLATYWGVTVAGQDLARNMAMKAGRTKAEAQADAKFAYTVAQATGGGIGLLLYGPFCQWAGRRRAFAMAHVIAILVVPVTCLVPKSYNQLLIFLPFYGALTMWMHAGYAIYFPELFPTRLRALGTSFCFNGGRIVAAVMLPLSGKLKATQGLSLPWALTILSSTYLIGLVVLQFLPETKNQPLPE